MKLCINVLLLVGTLAGFETALPAADLTNQTPDDKFRDSEKYLRSLEARRLALEMPLSGKSQELFNRLQSTNIIEANGAMHALLECRQNVIEGLKNIVESTNASQQSKVYAVKVLGLYRAEEAVGTLLNHLEMNKGTGKKLFGLNDRDESSPVVKALARIGASAVKAVMDKIPDTKDPEHQWIFASVLFYSFGIDEAQAMLNKRISVETNQERRQNLMDVSASVAKHKPISSGRTTRTTDIDGVRTTITTFGNPDSKDTNVKGVKP